jgi:iron(III) transport system permease protein
MAVLVISNIIHFYTVSFLTATTSLRQVDKEFENVSSSMGVPFYKTFLRVTVPLSLSAIIEVGLFYFVSAMATVSAVIFLYSPGLELASVAVVNMDDAGDTAPAAAMCILIVLTNIGVRGLFEFLTRNIRRKAQAWIGR